ncbi:MAG: hypothetical protein AAF660_07095 [Pseudomonadota bacterium]
MSMISMNVMKLVPLLPFLAAMAFATAQERNVDWSADVANDYDDWASRDSIGVEDAGVMTLKPIVENGYLDETGRLVIDIYQEDYANLAVEVLSEEGDYVEAAALTVTIDGSSELFVPPEPETNEFGVFEFTLIGGDMGLDTVTVTLGNERIDILINIISFEAFTMPIPEVVEGGIPWETLLKAEVSFDDYTLVSRFPDEVSGRAGDTVRIAGFMMPLQTEAKQTWFLLTSNPPHCFFHIPGGAAGAIEVFSTEGIEVSWEPVILEGRFEPLEKSDSAVYRLHEARLVRE